MNQTNSSKDTILIVDDIQENVSVLYRFLSGEGFKILVAKNGKQALQLLKLTQPDIILLDVMMPPGINGFEVCKILKSQKETQDIPIIFMTALTDTIDKVKGFELGAADYVTKPIQQEEMLARINAHIQIRKLQVQLQARNQQLETRNMELEAFSRTVAHDLKNPISVIKGYLEMLLTDYSLGTPLDEEVFDILHLITEANDKTADIIDSLLLLAGVVKEVEGPKQPLDMSIMITHIIQQRLPLLLNKYQGEIIFNFGSNPSTIANNWPIAQGYAPWVEEVWANYLSNALKYGGRPPHLELGANLQNDETVRFWVRDNGQGLKKHEQNQLFTPFTRLHKDRAEGHGLGLSIVQKIIEKLDGKVGVESTEGQGCLFYFTLPVYSEQH
jgi:signal transduction histidine kinase